MNEIALRLAARLFDRPLIQNQYRSAFVEVMIEPYLAREGWRHVGDNWAGWDFQHERGMRLELKQSAAWQTWDPIKRAAASVRSAKGGPGRFDIATRAGWFDAAGAVWTKQVGRPAQIYVFAWHGLIGDAADHRNPDQWQFFILPGTALPPQKTLGLSRLRSIAESHRPLCRPGAARGPAPQLSVRSVVRSFCRFG
ncbi:MAG: hypothetical protein ACREFJ_13735 [Acetobacteraceae bacterium]